MFERRNTLHGWHAKQVRATNSKAAANIAAHLWFATFKYDYNQYVIFMGPNNWTNQFICSKWTIVHVWQQL